MERRHCPRVAIKTSCKASFHLDGKCYTNLRVVNLGSYGCCLIIPEPTVNRFNARPFLESWKLIHPKLPKQAIRAKVAWCRHLGKADSGYLEAGIQFLDVPASYSEELDRFLIQLAQAAPAMAP